MFKAAIACVLLIAIHLRGSHLTEVQPHFYCVRYIGSHNCSLMDPADRSAATGVENVHPAICKRITQYEVSPCNYDRSLTGCQKDCCGLKCIKYRVCKDTVVLAKVDACGNETLTHVITTHYKLTKLESSVLDDEFCDKMDATTLYAQPCNNDADMAMWESADNATKICASRSGTEQTKWFESERKMILAKCLHGIDWQKTDNSRC